MPIFGSAPDQGVVNAALGTMARQSHDSVTIAGGVIGTRTVADVAAGIHSLPVLPGTYTRTTLPAASAFTNYIIAVTDATGGRCVAQSDGTAWISQRTGAAV